MATNSVGSHDPDTPLKPVGRCQRHRPTEVFRPERPHRRCDVQFLATNPTELSCSDYTIGNRGSSVTGTAPSDSSEADSARLSPIHTPSTVP